MWRLRRQLVIGLEEGRSFSLLMKGKDTREGEVGGNRGLASDSYTVRLAVSIAGNGEDVE